MNSKDKAKELINEFYPFVQWKLGQEDCLDRAKKCALVTVNELLKNCYEVMKPFWQEVKQEIESYDTKRKSK
jgi:hypothetical protein